MTKRRTRLTILVGTVSLATMGLAPLIAGPASAVDRGATARVGGNGGHDYTFWFDGGEGHDTHVILTLAETADHSAFVYTFDDATVSIGENCTYPVASDHTKVSCTIENFVDKSIAAEPTARVNVGSGNDTVAFTNLNGARIHNNIGLGEGDNTYTSGDPNAIDGAYVYSGGGADTFTLGTEDSIDAGAGNDVVTLAGGSAVVFAGYGNDLIDGGAGSDALHGGPGDDTISGNDGNDYVAGEQGNDTLYGGRGNDTVYGNSGDDVMYGNSGDDWLSGGPGTDTISGGAGTNTVLN
jgi:Ca2+-binding RTX toxin-like protein